MLLDPKYLRYGMYEVFSAFVLARKITPFSDPITFGLSFIYADHGPQAAAEPPWQPEAYFNRNRQRESNVGHCICRCLNTS